MEPNSFKSRLGNHTMLCYRTELQVFCLWIMTKYDLSQICLLNLNANPTKYYIFTGHWNESKDGAHIWLISKWSECQARDKVNHHKTIIAYYNFFYNTILEMYKLCFNSCSAVSTCCYAWKNLHILFRKIKEILPQYAVSTPLQAAERQTDSVSCGLFVIKVSYT